MIEATTLADLRAAIGETVRIVGHPVNTKASPRLDLLGGGSIHCHIGATHWPDEYDGTAIEVTGVVAQLAGPVYPVATCDKDGNWSQGVGASAPMLATRFGLSTSSFTHQKRGSDGDLVIRATKHSAHP